MRIFLLFLRIPHIPASLSIRFLECPEEISLLYHKEEYGANRLLGTILGSPLVLTVSARRWCSP